LKPEVVAAVSMSSGNLFK